MCVCSVAVIPLTVVVIVGVMVVVVVVVVSQCIDVDDIAEVRPGKMSGLIDGSEHMLVC